MRLVYIIEVVPQTLMGMGRDQQALSWIRGTVLTDQRSPNFSRLNGAFDLSSKFHSRYGNRSYWMSTFLELLYHSSYQRPQDGKVHSAENKSCLTPPIQLEYKSINIIFRFGPAEHSSAWALPSIRTFQLYYRTGPWEWRAHPSGALRLQQNLYTFYLRRRNYRKRRAERSLHLEIVRKYREGREEGVR